MDYSLSPVTIQQITVFIRVAEENSFSKAAVQLHMTQSAVSKSVQKLEQYISLTLFERTTRELKLTQPGQILYQEWKRQLTALYAGYNRAAQINMDSRSVLSLGLLNTARTSLYFDTIEKNFHAACPDVTLNLKSAYMADLVEQLASNLYDAIMIPDFERYSLEEHGLTWKWAARGCARLLIPRDHPLALRDEIQPQELSGCLFIAVKNKQSANYIRDLTERLAPFEIEPEIIFDFSSAFDLKYLYHPKNTLLFTDQYFDYPDTPDIVRVNVRGQYNGIICAYNPANHNPALKAFLKTLPDYGDL